jgi:hypothetical protein
MNKAPESSSSPEPHHYPKGIVPLRGGYFNGRLTTISSDVALPAYVGEIGINVQALLNLARLAGFKSIKIISGNNEVSHTTFGLQGDVGRDGTLRGSVSATTTLTPIAESDIKKWGDSDENIDPFENYVPMGKIWSQLTIKINTKEIQNRILANDHFVRDTNAWAEHINEAIADQMLKKGRYNLISGGDKNDLRDFLLTGVLAPLINHLLLSPLNTIAPLTLYDILIDPLFYLMLFSYGPFKLNHRRGNGPARFSLFGVNAPALDRLLILYCMRQIARSRKLVQPLPSQH